MTRGFAHLKVRGDGYSSAERGYSSALGGYLTLTTTSAELSSTPSSA